MKNQYVGDIGDYGKYSLLRFIAFHGVRIGINWYLTKNDESSDGKHTDYLKKDSDSIYDPIVYNALKKIVEEHDRDKRSVQMVQDAGLIPNALFFDEKLDEKQTNPLERAWERYSWYGRSKSLFKEVDLVFADPDNGISYKKTSRRKGCEKFVLPEEIAQYYYDGKDVVFYCHKGRRTDDEWERTKSLIKEHVCDARLFVLTFHRGTQRSYIFVVHPERADQYEALLAKFISESLWGERGIFTRENIAERKTDSTPDICERMAVLSYFQKAFRTESDKDKALKKMSLKQIDELVSASFTAQGKNFYNSYKRKKCR